MCLRHGTESKEVIAQKLHLHLPVGRTLITNNPVLLETFPSLPSVRTILLGGELLECRSALQGNEAVKAASTRRGDLALPGSREITEKGSWNFQRDIVRLE